MKKVWLWVGLALLVLSSIAGLWWKNKQGVSTFDEKMRLVEAMDLSLPEKLKIELEFEDGTDKKYSGSLVKATENQVWIEGSQGLKIYSLDPSTTLFFYSLCAQIKGMDIDKANPGMNTYDMDKVTEWSQQVSEGDYVSVVVNLPPKDKGLNSAQEVRVYDWWPMIPSTSKDICGEN